MKKKIISFIMFSAISTMAIAATRDAQLTNTTPYNYNYMYPYLNNQMRTDLNPGTTTSLSSNPINTVVKTQSLSGTRRVIARPQHSRTATSKATPSAPQTNRAATTGANSRRVVSRPNITRSATGTTTKLSPIRSGTQRAIRDENAQQYPVDTNARATESTAPRVSSVRCMADYTECMNRYCMRPDTAYNRCYCSSKLAQIDYKYQTEIDALIKKILTIQNKNEWSAADMNTYWMETIGKYTNDNSWQNLDNALNIDWASLESRVRGQTAFTTGHDYCIQHLRGCGYMISNLRDAYRSEIGRDCTKYEASLIQLKNAAESIVSTYRD